jgi:Virulence activator alpha C-term
MGIERNIISGIIISPNFQIISTFTSRNTRRINYCIYAVTALGRDYLGKWIAIPTVINPLKDDLLVKLFAGDLVEPDVILAELEHHRAQHQDC